MMKGETERENGIIWELETVFCLNVFTYHRATKTWVSWKLFYSNLFGLIIMFNMVGIKADKLLFVKNQQQL